MPEIKKRIQRKWSSIMCEVLKQQTQILNQFNVNGLLKDKINIKWPSKLRIPKMLVWTTLSRNGKEFDRALELLQQSSSALSDLIMEDPKGVLHLIA